MTAPDQAAREPGGLIGPSPFGAFRQAVERVIRRFPIRWRIMSIAGINSAIVVVLAIVIWDGAKVLNATWAQLLQVRQSDRLLLSVEGEAGRLQSLIHRYFTQPNPDVLAEIERRRAALMGSLNGADSRDATIAQEASALTRITERLLAGFDALRDVRGQISRIYDDEVLKSAREMSGLYAILQGASEGRGSLVLPALGKSREAFSATLVAANAYYFSLSYDSAEEAFRNIATIEKTVPVMLDLAETDLQKQALRKLGERAETLAAGLDRLSASLNLQARLLRDTIDRSGAEMAQAAGAIARRTAEREMQVQNRLDRVLRGVFVWVGVLTLALVIIIVVLGAVIARSVSGPLEEIGVAMGSIVAGRFDHHVQGADARDEIGHMARAVEVFQNNAIAKQQAEADLRASKEEAERALADLRDTQQSLIEAEKLAALGGLVAGVAHEVNNPVGISLTVASALAERCKNFAGELESGQLRRSQLAAFVDQNRDAARQLVANLQRAGDLIQSFKQVAVDRSHADRRVFDLRAATEDILASLRPGLKLRRLALVVDIPDGIQMDGDAGAYGQVLTNLFLNTVTHAFADQSGGHISIVGRPRGSEYVEIHFSDDGRGMPGEVMRQAFDPFFTTRRGQGGTGLGLHIVYNVVTQRLGGRITLSSVEGHGTTFVLVLPRVAPGDAPARTPATPPVAEISRAAGADTPQDILHG
ncbi:histidine kinase [Alsobacter metallidurans]|uniref:histidine kinase n=1 Tax=Alsobacter metallidurans TaxID=340221 RepID=A0A917I3H0_9HYPH|nr:ATP-binding protein [Alsobacter metallidurans]GGH06698.1 histidine kinase [Alsobacter metallidurans]